MTNGIAGSGREVLKGKQALGHSSTRQTVVTNAGSRREVLIGAGGTLALPHSEGRKDVSYQVPAGEKSGRRDCSELHAITPPVLSYQVTQH